MKPTDQRAARGDDSGFSSARLRCRFPLVNCNYRVFSLDRFPGGSTGSPRSFLNISRDYFRREARRNFLAEVAFFLIIVVILAGAFIEGARAIIQFLKLPPA